VTAHILSISHCGGSLARDRAVAPGWDNIVGGSSARLAAVFSAVLVVGYAYHQRVVYGEGHLDLAETSGRTRGFSP
jgi:hypothetical protein